MRHIVWPLWDGKVTVRCTCEKGCILCAGTGRVRVSEDEMRQRHLRPIDWSKEPVDPSVASEDN